MTRKLTETITLSNAELVGVIKDHIQDIYGHSSDSLDISILRDNYGATAGLSITVDRSKELDSEKEIYIPYPSEEDGPAEKSFWSVHLAELQKVEIEQTTKELQELTASTHLHKETCTCSGCVQRFWAKQKLQALIQAANAKQGKCQG